MSSVITLAYIPRDQECSEAAGMGVANTLFSTAIQGPTTGVLAHLFMGAGFVAGGVFGATNVIVGSLLNRSLDALIDLIPSGNNMGLKILKTVLKIDAFILSWSVGIGAGIAVAVLMGLPITFGAGVLLAGFAAIIEGTTIASIIGIQILGGVIRQAQAH